VVPKSPLVFALQCDKVLKSEASHCLSQHQQAEAYPFFVHKSNFNSVLFVYDMILPLKKKNIYTSIYN
jgi:hypothetical protein